MHITQPSTLSRRVLAWVWYAVECVLWYVVAISAVVWVFRLDDDWPFFWIPTITIAPFAIGATLLRRRMIRVDFKS